MNVPFIDFSEQYRAIKDQIQSGLKRVFEKGDFILGEAARDFEKEFARYCGVRYGVGVNSGTDALYLAVSAFDIGEGDEVILPAFTFIATALCISYTGARPVFVDIEEDTYNIDPQKIEKAITKRTKAIIPVHIYGQVADMEDIQAVAKFHKLQVIEDAAQAHGATYQKKKAGAIGDVACFSFYPTKGLGAFGDAGMIVTDNEKIYKVALMLRDYGRQGRYEHKVKGYNSRLDTVQAVVLSAKLKYLDEWNAMRCRNARHYNQLLGEGNGIIIPTVKYDRTHVFQTYAVRLRNRDKILKRLKEKNIDALIHYPIPLHLQEAYKDLGYRKGDFPVSEEVAKEILSLPMYPHMHKKQVEYVAENLKKLVSRDS